MAQPRKPLLDLTTEAPDRPFIHIDGQPYYMRTLDDFGVEDNARLRQYQTVFNRLQVDAYTDNSGYADDLRIAVREFIPLVLDGCPDEVIEKLSEGQKLRILHAFLLSAGLASQEMLSALRSLQTSAT